LADDLGRKLDRRILPAFWVLYFICSAIRSNIGLAQTMNLASRHDLGSVLGITPKQVSTGLALFYVCYVVFDLPSNLVMTRVSPHAWMSRIVTCVGIIGMCLTAMKAAWSLYLLRLLLGIVIAGMWPGMSYYLTLFYPPSRTGKRIGRYFTASQMSAAVVGLVSAGLQKMDGLGGLVGFQWMFLLYGMVGVIVGISLLWWLPDRPLPPGEVRVLTGLSRYLPASKPALTGEDAQIHYEDLTRVYHRNVWSLTDLWAVMTDWRIYPLVIMYFGVVGVGNGTQAYATVIIRGINPKLTGIQLSLLSAPIWIVSGGGYSLRHGRQANLGDADGSRGHLAGDARFRPLSPPPCRLLQRGGHGADHGATGGDVCPWLVALRGRVARGIWAGADGAHLHDLVQRDLPATARRGGRGGGQRAGVGAGQPGQHPDDVRAVLGLAGRRPGRAAPVPQE